MEAVEEQKQLTGKRAVKAYLIEPLIEDGLVRPPRTTVDAHEAQLDKIAEKLAYCERETLERLRPMVLSVATGPSANVWPSYATVRNYAHALQPPPDNSDKTLHGWLHSRAGEVAQRNGTLLATRWFIKKYRRPPVVDGKISTFMLREIEEKQRELDLDIEERRERVARGDATQSEREWLERAEDVIVNLDAIVASGIQHRAEKADANAETQDD